MTKQPANVSSCMAWPLIKYGRWCNRAWNIAEDHYSNYDNPLILRVQIGELVIIQGNTILDVLNLTAGPSQIKGISKGAALCVYVKYGDCYRKFRIKFAVSDGKEDFKNCLNAVKSLRKFFYIKFIEDKTSNVLDESEEFVDIRPVNWTFENVSNIPEGQSCLTSNTSGLDESIIATLLDPAIHEICKQINDTINSW